MYFGSNPIVKYLVDIRDIGLEWVARRYYTLYAGEVVPFRDPENEKNKEDPQGQSRVCVKVGILGVGTTSPNGEFDPTPIERCALPASIYAGKDHGMYFPPEVGNAVWVSFDHGDPDHPRVHGSWWRNNDPNMESKGSEVPAEFRLDRNGDPIKGPPTRRGIKTKFGHGLIFSDEDAAPYVAIWSGQTTTADTTKTDFKAATVKQQITLSDNTSTPTVKDEKVEEGIYANTFYGHRLSLNDTQKTIMISGLRADVEGIDANSIKVEDIPSRITVKTRGLVGLRHEVILDDLTGLITIKTKNPAPQTIVLDGNTGNITITSPGAVALNAAGGISMGSGLVVPPPTAGAAVEKGIGTKLIDFTGHITENILSTTQTITTAFVQTAATIAQTAATSITLAAPNISLLGGLITIGDPVTARNLANDLLVDFVLNHTHPTAAVGPPSVPTPGPVSTLAPGFVGLPLPPITLAQYATVLKGA